MVRNLLLDHNVKPILTNREWVSNKEIKLNGYSEFLWSFESLYRFAAISTPGIFLNCRYTY